MSSKHCAIPGCTANKARNRGLSFFRICQRKDKQWEEALVRAVNRSDRSFNIKNANICSRHFKPECFIEGKGEGRALVPGSLPTEFMPKKSIETPKPPARKPPVERKGPEPPERVAYYSFEEVRKAVAAGLPAPWCVLSSTSDKIILGSLTEQFQVKLKVSISPDFSTKVSVFDFPVSVSTTNVEKVSVKVFLHGLSCMHVCPGVTDAALQKFSALPEADSQQLYYTHVEYTTNENNHIVHKSTVRSKSCQLLLQASDAVCKQCSYTESLLQRKNQRSEETKKKPISLHTPLRYVDKEKLAREYKAVRKENSSLQNMIKKSLESDSLEVDLALHKSLKNVLDDFVLQDPFQKLFWEEQVKAFKAGPKGMRWHPMMLRLAILLHSKSPSAYETLRNTGVLRLPGESTLRDYTNVYHPKPGFQLSALEDLKKAAENLNDSQKFVVLLHDEMTIKADLVFDSRSGELVGFVNNHQEQPTVLATHALMFYVVGVSSNISTSIGFFGTQSVTADTMYPLFWQAVGHVEKCGLKVIASTSDKASPNLRLYDLHGKGTDICYKTTNLHARDREIFFFSDPPHLIKTVRNNLYNSGSGRRTRYLWRNNKHLLWKHIFDIYNKDISLQLRKTKLTFDHVYLTPSSAMNVRLACQVLSSSVGKVMVEYGDPECQETANFILKVDRFFDCLNVRSLDEGGQKRKPDLLPYRDVNDERFAFLESFQEFLIEWRQAVMNRPGEYSQAERAKMFLTHQTFKGLCITLKSFPEATRYLLQNGVQFVLSNKFCQDPLEKHFGRQRSMGGRSDNPSLWRFAYNANQLRLGRSLTLAIQPKGNVKRAADQNQAVTMSTSPLKKVRRN